MPLLQDALRSALLPYEPGRQYDLVVTLHGQPPTAERPTSGEPPAPARCRSVLRPYCDNRTPIGLSASPAAETSCQHEIGHSPAINERPFAYVVLHAGP